MTINPVSKNPLTNRCLSFLNGKFFKGFDSVLLTGMISIDIQKVLDTINHKLLIRKLIIAVFLMIPLSMIPLNVSTLKVSTLLIKPKNFCILREFFFKHIVLCTTRTFNGSFTILCLLLICLFLYHTKNQQVVHIIQVCKNEN